MIDVTPLFLPMHQELVALLRGLPPEAWRRETRAGAWTVRDVAAHLLDGDARVLSLRRDGLELPPPDPPVENFETLLAYLNRLNAEWTAAARRLSPALLVDMLAVTGPQVAEYFASLDLEAPAHYPVAWVGQTVSPTWLDLGREYTERWHHQQQIRDAAGVPGLSDARWVRPMLEISVLALPHAYRAVAAPVGATVSVEITGEAPGTWRLERRDDGWTLESGDGARADARLTLSADTAWRIFFKNIGEDEAAARVAVEGEAALARPLLTARAVMA